jgi:hypothetical protein
MSDTDRPPDPPEGRASDYLADAVAEVMKDQAEKAVVREEALAPLDQPPSATPWIALGVLTLISLFLWFGSPGFLETSPLEPLPPDVQEAGVRMEIYLQALKVQEYLRDEGRLPNSLAEAGDPFSPVEYERMDRRSYRLWLQGPAGIVELTTADSLEAFLGNARQIIGGGGG